MGLASYVEPCALGWESGAIRVERSGKVTAITGSSAHGQGHETTFAQVVADHVGVTPDEVTVLHGDTRSGPEGFGTFGSRSVALGGGALVRTSVEVREKGRRIAARLLEAAPEDIVPVRGGFQVAGVPGKRVAWKEVATAAYAGGQALPPGDTPGLEATTYFQPDGEVWSSGAVVCGLSIEPETGVLHLETLVWVDDAGTIINPLLAEGQLHGALAQGLGQALMEAIVYDADGQCLTSTLMDYAIPRATDVPALLIEKMHTASPQQPARSQGPRRGRLHRDAARGGQRGGGRARPARHHAISTCRSPPSACAPRSRSDASEPPAHRVRVPAAEPDRRREGGDRGRDVHPESESPPRTPRRRPPRPASRRPPPTPR